MSDSEGERVWFYLLLETRIARGQLFDRILEALCVLVAIVLNDNLIESSKEEKLQYRARFDETAQFYYDDDRNGGGMGFCEYT